MMMDEKTTQEASIDDDGREDKEASIELEDIGGLVEINLLR